MSTNKEIDPQIILQLYEKGIVSGETVLGAFGIDLAQEIKRKESDIVLNIPHVKPFINTIERKQIRIENARRNLEAILKGVTNTNIINSNLMSLMIQKASENLEIMSEVKDI